MNKKYIVRLSDEERKVCEQVIKDQKGKSEKLRRAQMLRKADVDGPGWKDEKISEAVGCRVRTLENVRMQLVLEGFDGAQPEEAGDFTHSSFARWSGRSEAHRDASRQTSGGLWPLVVETVGRSTGGTGNRGIHQP